VQVDFSSARLPLTAQLLTVGDGVADVDVVVLDVVVVAGLVVCDELVQVFI
jgi:hypothetical protein